MIKSKFAPIILLLTTILFTPVWVQANEVGLAHRVAALETLVAEQAGYISTLQAQVANLLLADPGALAAIFAGVSRTDDDIFFDGVNIHIRNGLGSTDGWDGSSGNVNGLGNLIVGYNEERFGAPTDRTGSHNLVVGIAHNYSSFGGLVAGILNTVSGQFSSVTGGFANEASGNNSSVSGGAINTASNDNSSVSGGQGNAASGFSSSVSGGFANEASGNRSSVSGGIRNMASGDFSSVSGGADNEASGLSSSVSGGLNRSAVGQDDWRAGSLFEDF